MYTPIREGWAAYKPRKFDMLIGAGSDISTLIALKKKLLCAMLGNLNNIGDMAMKSAVLLVSLVGLFGCTTPLTVLKNEQTGQVAQCGGSATGSMVGGVIGYHIQKSNDAQCVQNYMEQGFKVQKVQE